MSTVSTHPRALEVPNAMALPCLAHRAIQYDSRAQLPELQALFEREGMPVVLAGASNVVLPREFNRLVVLMRNQGVRLAQQTPEHWLVEVAAGENWHAWVQHSLAQGWPGLENLALIPGTVGAAPIQNIGAYGVEMAQRLAAVEIWDFDQGQSRWLSVAECAFGYRDSVFKQPPGKHWLVLTVRFALAKRWQPVLSYPDLKPLQNRHERDPQSVTATDVFDHVVAVRQAKLPDPEVKPNVGSFFKNPIVSHAQFEALHQRDNRLVAYGQPDGRMKLAAGWLIEQCGYKGKRMGAVAVHERQALVLVNEGGASASDVLSVAQRIATDVQAKFGVALEMEPICLA
jgi:UDP-N-acetylmuramate dehydrogenase